MDRRFYVETVDVSALYPAPYDERRVAFAIGDRRAEGSPAQKHVALVHDDHALARTIVDLLNRQEKAPAA